MSPKAAQRQSANLDALALALLASDRVLYLAVPLDTYEAYFTTAFVQTILDKATINLMVYSVLEEEVVLWRP